MTKRLRTLAAKTETTPGTAETLAAADAGIVAFDPMIQPNIEFEQRPKQNSFSHQPGELGYYAGTCTFQTELTGDGAGGVPFWAATLLPACGFVQNLGVFSPKSEAPGANVKTITIGVFQNGKYKVLRGAAGNAVFTFPTGRRVLIDWTFNGVFVLPVDNPGITPTYPTNRPFRFSAVAFSIGGGPGCVEEMTLDLGRTVVPRPCPTPTDGSGIENFMITSGLPTGTLNPEARTVAVEDVYGKWLAGTEEAMLLEFDDGTDKISIAAPKTQRVNVQEGDRDDIETDDVEYQCNAITTDDELTISFEAST